MSVSLREQHKQATADRLFEVAVDLFERRGFDSVTIEEISLEAGVSSRTFYRYFPIKEAVLYPDRDQNLAVLRDSILEADQSLPPWRVLEDAILALAAASADQRDLQLRRSRVSLADESIDRYQRTVLIPATEDVIAAAFAERFGVAVEADPRPLLLAGIGLAAMTAVTKAWTAAGGNGGVEGHIRETFATVEQLTAGGQRRG